MNWVVFVGTQYQHHRSPLNNICIDRNYLAVSGIFRKALAYAQRLTVRRLPVFPSRHKAQTCITGEVLIFLYCNSGFPFGALWLSRKKAEL